MTLEVTSADGTTLGVYVEGTGPALVLVHGGTADHTRWAPLIPLLRDDFSLVMPDRRGRGASANESDEYAIEREGEDVLAVLAAVEPGAMVFSHSYGATATLTVLDRLPASSVVLYEPPFDTSGYQTIPEEQLARWEGHLEHGEREAVLESFYRETLLFDDAALEQLRALPIWQTRLAAVHTLVREGRALRTFRPAQIRPSMPVRLLLGDSTAPHLDASTRAAADATAGSELLLLPGQGHVAIDAATTMIADHLRAAWLNRRR